jgi:nitroimidazol reductase NimA-like FMN-containing flavoprotein (pyridoxamine 5'-phosphate oxidase superfamily)
MDEPGSRATVHRMPGRAAYERDVIDPILDEAFVCHVGFVYNSQPCVIPTLYARDGDQLILHGSPASRMLRTLAESPDVCVTVTLIDGLVLARSAFHHSLNYRSVVIFGRAVVVDDPEQKLHALRKLVEHIGPGRWDVARPPSERELRQTLVLAVHIDDASAKVRTGPPVDDEEDYKLSVWAGVVPLALTAGAPVPDDRMPEHIKGP